MRKITATTAVILLLPGLTAAQNKSLPDTGALHRNRYKQTIAGIAATYTVGMSVLYRQWYMDYPQSRFHFFNDAGEWLQMDKVGHAGSAYYLSRINTALVSRSGVSNRKALVTGMVSAFAFMTTIEMFDGFSSAWGFSVPDMAANTAGVLLFGSQQLLWNEQRIQFKYSAHQSGLAQYRPNLLGSNFAERLLKDYNGQTYWLSANLSSFHFLPGGFPRWLNLAAGYGADGMLGAFSNPEVYNAIVLPKRERVKQYYLSADIDLGRIKTKSMLLNSLFSIFGFIKIPAPAIEFRSNGKLLFKPLYF